MNKNFLWLLSIMLIVSVACSFTGSRSNNEAQPQVEKSTVVVEQPVEVDTVAPPPVEESSVVPEMPATEEVVQEEETKADEQYYTEEFDGDTSAWYTWVAAGDSTKNFTEIRPGIVSITLPATETYVYFANENFEYDDVYVEGQFTPKAYGDNGIALACRISDDGWYELRVHTSGFYAGSYEVYRYDQNLRNAGKNPYVNLMSNPRLNSVDILTAGKTNIFALLCVDNTITPIFNGITQTLPRGDVITDDMLSSGKIGVGGMSFANGKVEFEIDYISVEAP